MSPSRDRGPSDYAEDPEYLRAVIEGMVRAQGGYNEGPPAWAWKIILMLMVPLVVGGVGGMIVAYAKLAAVEERTLSIQAQVNDIKHIVEPHYRGAEPGS